MKKMLIALSLAIAVPSFALETNCDKYKNSYDRTYCLSKLFVESDKELNDVYKELREKLNSDGQKALKETELRWIKYRTSRCEVMPRPPARMQQPHVRLFHDWQAELVTAGPQVPAT